MKNRVLDFISDNQDMLAHCRASFEEICASSPIEACELLHIGTNRAAALLNLGRTALDKGIIDRTILKAAVELANAWLDFDDAVLDVVAEEVPVMGLTVDLASQH